MASRAVITIRVTSSRGASTVQYTTKGRYISFVTAGYQRLLRREPIQPTTSLKDFWTSVLSVVSSDITSSG